MDHSGMTAAVSLHPRPSPAPLLRFGRGVGPRSSSPGAAKYLADAPGALKTEGEKKTMVINGF